MARHPQDGGWQDAVRQRAVTALETLGGEEAKKALERAAKEDPSPNVRQMAQTALNRIKQ